jgi:DNA-binding NarL/FixJ family response regulator
MSIKIAIFDDNKNIRNSIVSLLSMEISLEVVGVFSDAKNCVQEINDCKAEVILMDIQMPGTNGIEAVSMLKQAIPNIQIIIQTVFEDDDYIFDSILAGASGYILKGHLNSLLVNSIEELLSGGSPMSPAVARRVLNFLQQGINNKRKPSVAYNLTAREMEVLTYLVEGLSYKMIGYELNISYETVRSHIKHIYEKLHVCSLTQVVAKAIHQRLV